MSQLCSSLYQLRTIPLDTHTFSTFHRTAYDLLWKHTSKTTTRDLLRSNYRLVQMFNVSPRLIVPAIFYSYRRGRRAEVLFIFVGGVKSRPRQNVTQGGNSSSTVICTDRGPSCWNTKTLGCAATPVKRAWREGGGREWGWDEMSRRVKRITIRYDPGTYIRLPARTEGPKLIIL